jgi:hypothetical protein
MNKKILTEKELDALLCAPGTYIEDYNFSSAVMKRLRRKKILTGLVPAISGFIGALITVYALPDGWVPSFLNRLISPFIEIFQIDSSGLFLFMTRYGIEPSLFWIFLAVPLFILPFAIHQD